MSTRDESAGPDPPERFGGFVQAAADGLSGLVRRGLALGALPARVLPRAARAGISSMVRLAVDASAVVPHAVAKGAVEFARELDD